MAKLKAPLLSLAASGSIAKTLTYFSWKGLNVVREWVKPANPNTTRQSTHRQYLTDCVDEIHTTQAQAPAPMDQDDYMALNALATTLGRVMTWFNMQCKLWIDCKVDTKTPIIYSNGGMSETDKDDFRPGASLNEETPDDLAAGHFFLGATPTSLINSIAAIVNPHVDVHLADGTGFSGLTAGRKYFWQFRPDALDLCEGADSGIYYAYAT